MLRRMDILFGYLCKFDRKHFELNIILNRFGSATFKKLMQKGVDLSFFREWYYVNLIFIYSWERYINIKVPHYSREYLLKVVHYEEDQRKSGNSSLFSDCKWSIHISGKICECPRESGLGVCLYIYTYKYMFVRIYIYIYANLFFRNRCLLFCWWSDFVWDAMIKPFLVPFYYCHQKVLSVEDYGVLDCFDRQGLLFLKRKCLSTENNCAIWNY